MTPPCVILAGGAATRMGGGDKGLLEVAGRPLLAHVLTRLKGQAGPVALNANGEAGRFADWNLPMLPDRLPQGVEALPGPLAGILAGLDWAAELGAPALLTVAWDTPFFPLDLAAKLAEADAPVAMAATPDPARAPHRLARHPTFALWRADLAETVREALIAGERRVVRPAETAGCALVAFPAEPFDPFFNVNAPADLAEAEALLARHGAGEGAAP
ncbi:MAG: molybdenum cofactor guanylyltransferase MobA [Pseudomonadota bacterium]